MENTVDISCNIKVSVHKGDYGVYLKVHRGERWMSLAASLFNILQNNVHKLKTIGDIVYLTTEKRVEVTEFRNKRYVCFIQQCNDFKTFINFHEDEWSTFVAKMPQINIAIIIEDIDCKVCQNLKKPIRVTKDKRMMDTQLTNKKLQELQDWNCHVQNQQGIVCTYCGVEVYDDCHCHRYDCKICEPDNFCSSCASLLVYLPAPI